MDPPDISEAVICTRWPCPTPTGLAVGGVYVEIERLSSHKLNFFSVFDNLQREENKFRHPQPFENRQDKIKPFFPFFSSQRRYEDVFGCSLKAMLLKQHFWIARSLLS